MYLIFHRTWWVKDSTYPGGLRPQPGRKTKIGIAETEEKAREMCRQYNETHNPGPLSRKAEYEKV